MHERRGPLEMVLEGAVAGAVGSLAQTLFFAATRRVAPRTPRDAFDPPEAAQRSESPTETVARRGIERLMQRGPLSDREKRLGGRAVHYGFGAAWGMDYALHRESYPALASARGVFAFGTAVWLLSDNALLPAFRLAAWPGAYPARNHAYAWAAHLAYAASVCCAYEGLRACAA